MTENPYPKDAEAMVLPRDESGEADAGGHGPITVEEAEAGCKLGREINTDDDYDNGGVS